MLTTTQLSSIFPQAETSTISAFISAGLQALKSAGILDGANRLAYFLAQLGHESNGLTVREENLNYSATRLMQVWPSRFPTLESAKKYENQPEKLANFVYGGRLGNIDDGDGYKYRGRGYIQLTGRDTYKKIGDMVGLDLESNPDLASQPGNAAKIACAFWTSRNINPACDSGDFTAVTKLINGGLNGLADRQTWLSKVQTVLATPAPTPAQPKPTPAPTPVTPAPVTPAEPHDPLDDPAESFANDAVRMAQAKLKRLGYYTGIINGIYNQVLRSALMEFQRQEGLTPTGRLDGATMAELNV
jgi:putative chitinase